MSSTDSIAAKWVKDVEAAYSENGKVRFVCAGHWLVTLFRDLKVETD